MRCALSRSSAWTGEGASNNYNKTDATRDNWGNRSGVSIDRIGYGDTLAEEQSRHMLARIVDKGTQLESIVSGLLDLETPDHHTAMRELSKQAHIGDLTWDGAEGLEWEVPSPAPFHTFETPPNLDATATRVVPCARAVSTPSSTPTRPTTTKAATPISEVTASATMPSVSPMLTSRALSVVGNT